jgi:hypothetical protein
MPRQRQLPVGRPFQGRLNGNKKRSSIAQRRLRISSVQASLRDAMKIRRCRPWIEIHGYQQDSLRE